jgi:hypothetical protein
MTTARERAMAEWCTCGVRGAGDCPRHDLDHTAPRDPAGPDVSLRRQLDLEGDPRWAGFAAQFPDRKRAAEKGDG